MTGIQAVAGGNWAEPATLTLMLTAFALLAVGRHFPIGVALVLSAWIGAAVNGDLLPVRHLVEGALSYLDPILVIATAMMLMRVLADGGLLDAIGVAVERRFGDRPVVLLPVLMLIVMFPGMVTGSSTASVLTTGAMVAPILMGIGLTRDRVAALVAMGGVLGMVAPPINIPAMLIGAGIDLPYVGFGAPLALAAFPLAAAIAYAFGWPALRGRARAANAGGVGRSSNIAVGADRARPGIARALTPPAFAAVLMAAPRIWPAAIADPGLPLTFLLSAALAALLAPARRDTSRAGFAWAALMCGVEDALPVLGILAGVGAFIQVMTLTGARGWLVAVMLGAPSWAVFAAAAVSIPLFGAVSAFGSASVLGVPFLLALLGRNEVVTTAGLSMLAALGDLMLPAALAATLAAQVTGVDDRRRVLRLCVVPAAGAVAVAVLMLVYSAEIGRVLR